LEVVDQVLSYAAAGKPLWLRKSKRVIQQMIDLLARDESSLIALVTLPREDRSTLTHASSVCILSLALGKRLGMAKFTLCELGLAALLHDIGKAGQPEPAPAQTAELSAQERQALQAHPVLGVRKVMQLKGLDSLSSRIITGVFEHHLLADFSGYPRLHYQRLSLFGRVISVADGFETLISSPAGGRGPYPPAKALGFLLAQAGKGYDQALLKLLISVIGLHPIGSLLQLDSRELAVVVGNHTKPDLYGRPRVKIISDPRGLEVDGAELDLALPAATRTIAGILDPRVYQLDVRRYFR
jgi:HD-GYP domain-containing protein (c-di-GMP phosphodiesterase class II)